MADAGSGPVAEGAASPSRAWLLLYSLVALALSVAVALGPLEGVAHVSDEVAYTLQSKLFASGLRTGPPADNPSMLLYPFWVTSPVSYAAFPPGWPSVLALGQAAGTPWLVNPLLASTLPLLIFGLTREWSNERTARLAALITAFSPAIWLLGSSRMSHTSVLVALAAAGLVLIRARDRPVFWLGAGAAIAYVLLTRPYDAFLLGIPMLVLGMVRGTATQRVALIGPVLMALSLLAVDNHALTGDALTFPIQQWAEGWYTEKPGCDRIGIGQEYGCLGEAHTPRRALELTWNTALRMDRTLIGVPGGLLLALIGLGLHRKKGPWLVLILISVGYSLYWSPGAAYGARFWHPMLLVLPLGLAQLALQVQDRWIPQSPTWAPGLLLAFACAAGGSRLLPELADRYWCVDGALSRHLESEGIEEGVVLIQGIGRRTQNWDQLGTEDFSCGPMLEAGSGLQLMDPTRIQDGLQVRHAPAKESDQKAYVEHHHDGAEAWIYRIDLFEDARSWESLNISDDPQAEEAAPPR